MLPLTPGELSTMAGTQQAAMMDSCKVLAYSSSPDAWGQPTVTYTPGAAIACGYSPAGGQATQEVQLEDKTLAKVAATVRLPLGTAVATRDRIQITHRFGVVLAGPITLEVAGPVRQGPSGLQVDLIQVVI